MPFSTTRLIEWLTVITMVCGSLAGAWAWADNTYMRRDSAIMMQKQSLETQMEILDEKVYRAERDGATQRAAEAKHRYELKKLEYQNLLNQIK